MLVVNRLWASDSQKPIAIVGDPMGYRISGSRKESLSTQDYFGALAARTAAYHVVLLLAGLLISIIISKKETCTQHKQPLKTRTSSILLILISSPKHSKQPGVREMPAEPQKEASKKTLSKSSTGSCITSICMDLRYFFFQKMPVFLPREKAHDILQDPEVPNPVSMMVWHPARWVFPRRWGSFFVEILCEKKEAMNFFSSKRWNEDIWSKNPLYVVAMFR